MRRSRTSASSSPPRATTRRRRCVCPTTTSFCPRWARPASRRPTSLTPGPTTGPPPRSASLAQLDLTGVSALYDITQLPTGEVVVVDGGLSTSTKIYVLAEDLSSVIGTYTSTGLGGQVTGLAYNDRTATLWVGVFQIGLVREITLAAGAITRTGRQFAAGFSPFGWTTAPSSTPSSSARTRRAR